MVFFLFKQKTAYEMRISDWSSDVCSSDLIDFRQRIAKRCCAEHVEPLAPTGQRGGIGCLDRPALRLRGVVGGLPRHQPERARVAVTSRCDADGAFEQGDRDAVFADRKSTRLNSSH